jgi:MFS family permease
MLSEPQFIKTTAKKFFGNLRFLKNDRNFNLLLATGFFAGISTGITSTTFNNFLNDVYHLSEASRGVVELPRELPGALLVLIFAAFSFMSDVRLASLGMAFASLGMFGLGLLSPGFAPMLIWMVVLNLGTHIGMPLAPSIGMSLSKPEEYGMRLGRYNSYCLAATIIGYIIVLVGFNYLKISYTAAFIIAGFCYLAAAVTYLFMQKAPAKAKKKPRFVFRKKYTVFYMQSITNGARKQIFLTFAPWVLIKIYHLNTPTFAVLGFVIAFVSIGTRTIIGRAIDKLGERIVLSTEAILLIILCMGYAFSADIFPV